jgi:hypothetical protein
MLEEQQRDHNAHDTAHVGRIVMKAAFQSHLTSTHGAVRYKGIQPEQCSFHGQNMDSACLVSPCALLTKHSSRGRQ